MSFIGSSIVTQRAVAYPEPWPGESLFRARPTAHVSSDARGPQPHRICQGSSGGVYPLPFTDRISSQREDRSWEAVHMENEFLRVMVLPEIGGRIHVGLDKTNGCDFF
jgi:hypothetical protein